MEDDDSQTYLYNSQEQSMYYPESQEFGNSTIELSEDRPQKRRKTTSNQIYGDIADRIADDNDEVEMDDSGKELQAPRSENWFDITGTKKKKEKESAMDKFKRARKLLETRYVLFIFKLIFADSA